MTKGNTDAGGALCLDVAIGPVAASPKVVHAADDHRRATPIAHAPGPRARRGRPRHEAWIACQLQGPGEAFWAWPLREVGVGPTSGGG